MHEAEEPDTVVFEGLLETLSGRTLLLQIHGVALNSLVGELTPFGRQPRRRQWEVRQDKASHDGDEESYCALENEQPLPARGLQSVSVTWRPALIKNSPVSPATPALAERISAWVRQRLGSSFNSRMSGFPPMPL